MKDNSDVENLTWFRLY